MSEEQNNEQMSVRMGRFFVREGVVLEMMATWLLFGFGRGVPRLSVVSQPNQERLDG